MDNLSAREMRLAVIQLVSQEIRDGLITEDDPISRARKYYEFIEDVGGQEKGVQK